jgi:hypothetical protein
MVLVLLVEDLPPLIPVLPVSLVRVAPLRIGLGPFAGGVDTVNGHIVSLS